MIVIGTGIYHRQPVYRRAHEIGCKLVFVSEQAVEWVKPYAHDWIICSDASDEAKTEASIRDYMKANPNVKVDGIVTFDEYSVLATAHVCKVFGYPNSDNDTVHLIKNKYLFRQHTAKAGILAPKNLHLSLSKVISGESDKELADFPYPAVLKPIAGAGSHFVRRIADMKELKAVLAEYAAEANSTGEYKYWGVDGVDASFMVEEMIIGNEVDIDLLVDHGEIRFLSISDNFPSTGPGHLFMEIGGACPSNLPADRQKDLVEMTHTMVKSFGKNLTGCFHFEAMSTPKGAYPIELNQRLGGSEVLVFILAAFGVNLGIENLKLAISYPIVNHDTSKPLRNCTSINFLSESSGYIEKIGYDDALFEDPSYMGSMNRCVVGHPLKAPPLGFEFLGWMVASGDTPQQAKKNLDRCTSYFKYSLRPFPRGDPHGLIPGTQTYYLDAIAAEAKAKVETSSTSTSTSTSTASSSTSSA